MTGSYQYVDPSISGHRPSAIIGAVISSDSKEAYLPGKRHGFDDSSKNCRLSPHLRHLLSKALKKPQPQHSTCEAVHLTSRRRPQLWGQSSSPDLAQNVDRKNRLPQEDYDSDEDDKSSLDEEVTKDESMKFFHRPLKRSRQGNRCDYILHPSDRKILVTFSNPLVTHTWTRPRTGSKEKSMLFYNKSDRARFRGEYRQEKLVRLMKEVETGRDKQEYNFLSGKKRTVFLSCVDGV
mmetsp:Transcript_10878/g.32196  ORF Transcript_10878/g.32196 Transcript_10878/m.32196 type:complete len:236 (-) Transcript_10878:85-792(-)